ncbi:hypothetical protein BDW02DRAFT_544277 [Decorospora gaudefroyi]|uniref:Mid2 domain-containing protein n=1 Tax=Decorospora gaudefroyi TaxID=184978 RepID=A0A6A5KN96_9PLEO|nr:hypothetical protein BDW02DRAFT_544277 [Decorospora gaudefroyi]
MFGFLISVFVIISGLQLVSCSLALARSPIIPPAPNATEPASLDRRQDISAPVTTCGYRDGNPSRARTADPGYGCRVDTANGLWGFCLTTVISAKDCGLAGVCVDSQSCTSGCGRLTDRTDITTFTCDSAQFCSTALLINGVDQSYEYIACGKNAVTRTLFADPTTVDATTTSDSSSATSSSPSSKPTNSVTQAPVSIPPSSRISSDTSSPTSATPAPSEQKPTNIGPIVGGVLGGLALICLTILGVVLIRRKRGAKGEAVYPPGYAYNDGNDFANTAESNSHNSRYIQKRYHCDSSHGPVELHGGHHTIIEPVELPGKTHSNEHLAGPK